jgi:hypothetical protein
MGGHPVDGETVTKCTMNIIRRAFQSVYVGDSLVNHASLSRFPVKTDRS